MIYAEGRWSLTTRDCVSYLLWHLLVIQDHDQNLHKVFRSNLLLECLRALVHQHVEQPQRQEHHLGFVRHEALANLERRRLATTSALRERSKKAELTSHCSG